MAVNLTLTTGFAVAGLSAASRARRSHSARAIVSIVVARSPGGACCRSNKITVTQVRSSSSSSIVAMTAVRRASRTTSSVRVAATAGDDAPDPEVDDDEEEEELDTEKLMKELTDTSQLMKRGEVFFLGQMLLIFLLVFTPGGGELEGLETAQKDAFDPLIGLALLALSGVLVVKSLLCDNLRALGAGGRYDEGVKDLGNSLSPFPKPRADNLLKTNGAYSVVRHPMYSGLAFGGFGVAILTGSPVRTIFAACLAVLLNFKAASEEEFLSDMHGSDVYGEYAAKVPRLIPTVEGLGRLLEDTFDGSFSKAGKKQQ